MMETKHYLIFSLKQSLYGIEALAVKEILFLPELTPVVEAPKHIVGVLNLRGEVLPVMDLNWRFGYQAREYSTNDSLILLEWQSIRVGIVVDRVHEVQMLSPDEAATDLTYGRDLSGDGPSGQTQTTHSLLAGIATMEADLVMLLDCQSLICNAHEVEALAPLTPEENQESNESDGGEFENGFRDRDKFCPQATPSERAIFRQRAEQLRQSAESQDFGNSLSLAVVGLSGEYFGVDLQSVREFTEICQITPVPCCPEHIVGNMNLRGEILTLVEIRSLLNLPVTESAKTSKAIVVQVDEIVAGITVDEVFDVTHLHPGTIAPVPLAVDSIQKPYLQGTASYQNKIMGILDLPKILIEGELVVDEELG